MNEETQKKILVADDSQVIQETLKRTLQEFGFAVVTAQNGI